MIAPQPNAEHCLDDALSSAGDESVASDGCEDVSGSVTTNKNKEDATVANVLTTIAGYAFVACAAESTICTLLCI